jgi:hypothetical protein
MPHSLRHLSIFALERHPTGQAGQFIEALALRCRRFFLRVRSMLRLHIV